MKKLIVFLLFIASFMHVVHAQFVPLNEKKYTDSLETLLKSNVSDSIKAIANFLLSDFWSQYDSTKGKQFLERGETLIHGNKFLEGLYNISLGHFYFDKKKFDTSGFFYKKGDSILSPLKNNEAIKYRANAWKAYAVTLQRKDDEQGFLNILLNKSIPLAEEAKDENTIGIIYITIGIAFMNKLEYAKASEYYEKGIS